MDIFYSTDDIKDEGLNVSMYDFPKEIWTIIPDWELTVKISTFLPVIVLGVLGNIIIINIITRNRALRTSTNYFIANMAVADGATLVICPVMFMFHDFYQNYKLGSFGCKIEGLLEGAFLIAGVLNLCAVSYERLTAIVLPMESRLTVRGAKFVMIITWTIGISLSIPLAMYRTYKEREWKNFIEMYCGEDTTFLPIYWHILITALVWLPLGVMVICYSAIFLKLDRYEKKILKREHPLSVSYKRKVAKSLFIIVITFVVLRVPFTTVVFIRSQMQKKTHMVMDQIVGDFQKLWYASHYLIFLNAAINPLIYGLSNDNFRRAYSQTPLCPCFYIFLKSKENKEKIHRSFGRLFYGGVLQPREPCRNGNNFVIKFQNDKSIFKVSKSATTQIANNQLLSTKYAHESDAKQRFQYVDSEANSTKISNTIDDKIDKPNEIMVDNYI